MHRVAIRLLTSISPEIFYKSLETSIYLKIRLNTSDRVQAVIEVSGRTLRVIPDHHIQEFQRRFGKSLWQLYLMQQMYDMIWMLKRLQPVSQFSQRFREGVLRCYAEPGEVFRNI